MRILTCSTAVIVATLLASPACIRAQQTNQSGSQGQAENQASAASGPHQESLADAARKAREQKKEAPKTVKTFTNDNLPTEGGISTVGGTPSAASTTASSGTSAATEGKGAAAQSPKNEKAWRERFETLHRKLQQDEANLEVMKRELAQLNIQYYGDPNQELQQQFTRSDINNKTSDIDKMQAQVDADKQAIADAEDELRKSGGDPGWAR